MSRALQIADMTLREVLLRLGYTHVPFPGSAFSKGIYRDGELVIRADVITVWLWLVITGQVQSTPTIDSWLAEGFAPDIDMPPRERVAAALERARFQREAAA